jgi:hypothetical protein
MNEYDKLRDYDHYVTFLLCFNLIEEDKKGKIEAVHELLNEIIQEEYA